MSNHVSAITSGALHSCALKDDGSVWCWGYNGAGQLGIGAGADSHAPARVTSLPGTRAIHHGRWIPYVRTANQRASVVLGIQPEGPRWSWRQRTPLP